MRKGAVAGTQDIDDIFHPICYLKNFQEFIGAHRTGMSTRWFGGHLLQDADCIHFVRDQKELPAEHT